jgi:DNA polymerase III epsilon subunit-like protein
MGAQLLDASTSSGRLLNNCSKTDTAPVRVSSQTYSCVFSSKAKQSFIDIEASGFGSQSYPIEIGVVTADGREYSRLVKPLEHWQHWDQNAQLVHGITRAAIEQEGADALNVAHDLNELLNDSVVYCDAWVVDKPWLDRLFDSVRVRRQFRISPIEVLLDEDDWDEWGDTKSQAEQSLGIKPHRALQDAKLIREAYRRVCL